MKHKKHIYKSVLLPKSQRYNWFEMKKEYLADPTLTLMDVARKHQVSGSAISVVAKREGWLLLRGEIYKRAEEKAIQKTEKDLAEVKVRHAGIGRILQAKGITAMKTKPVRSAKEALAYTTEGVRVEREAAGLDRGQSPQVVNIISQQREVIDRYKVEEGEIEEEK